jgi:hypothetical protein
MKAWENEGGPPHHSPSPPEFTDFLLHALPSLLFYREEYLVAEQVFHLSRSSLIQKMNFSREYEAPSFDESDRTQCYVALI